MCLDKLYDSVPKEGTYWKVFRRIPGDTTLESPVFSTEDFKIDKWIKDDYRKKISEPYGIKYPSGYHCFTNKADAETFCDSAINEVVRKVECKDIHTHGTQRWVVHGEPPQRLDVLVCNKIKILPILKDL